MLLFAGLLVLLAGVVWWQLPGILNWGLTQTLQQQGLTNITVQISEVGLSQATIDRLDVTYQEPDTTLHMQLKQVSVDYTLSQLLTGNAEKLLVDSVLVKLDHRAGKQVSTSPTLPTMDVLLAAYSAVDNSRFPLSMAQLPNISISHNLVSESTFDTVELQAEVTKHADQLSAKLLFAKQQEFSWTSDQDTGWTLEYFATPAQAEPSPESSRGFSKEANPRQPVFRGSLNQVDHSLVFSADIKPHLSQLWLPSTHKTDSAIKLSEIALTGTIKENNSMPGLAVVSTVQMRGLGYQDWHIQSLNGQFDMRLAQIAQSSAMPGQPQAPRQLNIDSNNTLSLTGVSFADWQADKVALSLRSDVSLAEKVSKITASDVLLTVGKLQQADQLALSDTSFKGAVSALIDADQWQLNVAQAWQLTGQYGRLDEIELPQGWGLSSTQGLHLKGAFQTSSQTEKLDPQLTADAPDILLLDKTLLEVTMPVVQDIPLTQRIRPLNGSLQIEQARFNQGQLVAKGLFAIPRLTIDTNATEKQPENAWRLDEVSQAFELHNDQLTSRGSVQSKERDLHIDTTSKHNFKQRQGSTEFRFKTLEFSDPQRLNQLIAPPISTTESPLSLVTGEVDLSGQARWRAKADQWQVTVDIDAQLNNLGGAYEGAYFSGAKSQLSLQVYPEILSKTPQRLSVAQVDAGVANTDVVVDFKLRPSTFGDLPIVDIHHAQTQLLQGSISLKPTAYDLNRSQQSLQLVLDNIDLNELVTLQQLDDVQATGLVSGLLPLIINNGQISIDDGELHALAPGGVLQYQGDAEALRANQYAESVVLALRDFNYDVLRADTQYQPDGTLLLKLQLQGNNPDFEQGRRVNLNINLEQNVLKLIESLRLYDGVSDKLDKRVQDFYQQTTSQ